MEIIWSPQAIEKHTGISDYIAKDAPERAIDFEDALISSVERLREFPESGQVTSENAGLRQVVHQGYRIIYRVRGNFVEIVTVFAPGEQFKSSS